MEDSLDKNEAWDLVEFPNQRNPIVEKMGIYKELE
jgi:hypothetical protein